MRLSRCYFIVLFTLAIAACSPDESEQQNSSASTENIRSSDALITEASLFDPEEIERWQAQSRNVTILRDKWGIAHIYGKTDADTVFGTLFAQAEDDFNRDETNYLNAMGRLAEAEGAGQLYRDLRMKLFIDPVDMQSQYEASPDWLKDLLNAFADGLNYYLYTHPEVVPRVIQRFEPWMALSFTEGSIGGDIERVNLRELENFYGPDNQVAQVEYLQDNEPRGSNGFAIAPAKTAGGNALLLINPHTSFFFRSELHMVSEEGLNAYGAVTWGQFFIYQGFNENTGWMHTSSRADAIDYYLETIVERNDGYYYRFGDEERKLRETIITLPYKDGDALSRTEITVYHSHHGPIIRERDGKWEAISLMQEPIKALAQSYGRTKANNYEEFAATMELRTNSSNNTVYADSKGNIAYWHGNFIPRRDARFDWNQPLDGSDPATDWKSLHPVNEMITLFNPGSGWIQNTNNTPFNAAGADSPRRADYPAYMANNPENPRGVHAVQVLKGRSDFTIDTLIEAAYEPTLTAFEELVPSLLLITAVDRVSQNTNSPNNIVRGVGDTVSIQSELLEYIDLLRTWDYKASVDSVETSLAVYWAENLISSVAIAASASGIDVYDYMTNRSTMDQKLSALRQAAQTLTRDFGSWQVPWGEINRYQRLNGDIVQDFSDDEPSLAVGFGSGRWGSLASFGSRTYPGTRRMYGTSGNSFVAAVEFGERLTAKAVTVGGLQSDPGSPHFDDQAAMYASGEFRDVLFYREDIEANLERAYNPGD
ncbi:MAG: penicillin acylase family protein [Proteobacteria bacterium]|nr:penicillin acylase family protein [Pseudomonadota bacterium]